MLLHPTWNTFRKSREDSERLDVLGNDLKSKIKRTMIELATVASG